VFRDDGRLDVTAWRPPRDAALAGWCGRGLGRIGVELLPLSLELFPVLSLAPRQDDSIERRRGLPRAFLSPLRQQQAVFRYRFIVLIVRLLSLQASSSPGICPHAGRAPRRIPPSTGLTTVARNGLPATGHAGPVSIVRA